MLYEICIPTPTSFNFLNWMKMIIILNKRGKVGMGATRPKLITLSSLCIMI